jgi:hypothetical protein
VGDLAEVLGMATTKEITVVTCKLKAKYFFLLISVFLTKLLAYQGQWWPKRHPLLLASAHIIQLG